MIEERWVGELPDARRPVMMLVAILELSNAAEVERDPFARRMRLNEMQDAIQGAKDELETFAEAIMFLSDDPQ